MQKPHQPFVDEEAASNPLLAFLDHVERLPDTIARRKRSYELLGLEKGSIVADIGCGAGTAVFEMHALVRPGGSAVGYDINEPLLAAGRARAARREIDVKLELGNAEALPLADGSLHGYRAERLYQHLREPAPFLKEAYRVLAPGGRIVLVDQDWDVMLFDSNDLATTRAIAHAAAGGVANGTVGRQYYRLLKDAGFVNVQVFAEMHVATDYEVYGFWSEHWAFVCDGMGALPSDKVQAWLADQQNRAANGRFFMAMTHFIALGQR